MLWYCRNIERRKCSRFSQKSLIYKTILTFWWQSNGKLEFRSQCHIFRFGNKRRSSPGAPKEDPRTTPGRPQGDPKGPGTNPAPKGHRGGKNVDFSLVLTWERLTGSLTERKMYRQVTRGYALSHTIVFALLLYLIFTKLKNTRFQYKNWCGQAPVVIQNLYFPSWNRSPSGR